MMGGWLKKNQLCHPKHNNSKGRIMKKKSLSLGVFVLASVLLALWILYLIMIKYDFSKLINNPMIWLLGLLMMIPLAVFVQDVIKDKYL